MDTILKRFIIKIAVLFLFVFSSPVVSSTVWDTISEDLSENISINVLFDMESDNLGNIWLAHNYGLAIYNGNTWKICTFDNSSVENGCLSFTKDTDGNIWIGTDSGIVVYQDTLLTSAQKSLGSDPPQSAVYDILYASDGTIWAATDGGVYSFDGTTWTNYYPSLLTTNSYTKVLEDKQNKIWVCSWSKGAACFDGQNWTVYDSSTVSGFSNHIYTMAMDSSGALWFSSVEEVAKPQYGIYKYDGSTWTNYNSSNSNLPYNNSYGLVVDRSGYLWAVTATGKLVRFIGDDFEIRENTVLSDGAVDAMYVDHRNRIFIGYRHLPIIIYDQHADSCGSITKINIENPPAGKVYNAGQALPILWSTVGCIDSVIIEYRIGTDSWQQIAGTVLNFMPYNWTIPQTVSSQYQIRISKSDDISVYDTTDLFSVSSDTGNNPPYITTRPDTITVEQDETTVWTALATDSDGDEVTFTFKNITSWMSFTDNKVTFAPVAASSDTTIRVIASDGNGGSDSVSILIHIDIPTGSRKNISLPKSSTNLHCKIEMFDLTGNLIRVVENTAALRNFDKKGLHSGGYIVKFTSGKNAACRKMVINR